jgi:hypothetical protein
MTGEVRLAAESYILLYSIGGGVEIFSIGIIVIMIYRWRDRCSWKDDHR